MRRSIEIRPYVRQRITDPEKPTEIIPEPISKMTEANKKQYFAYIKVMNYLLQGIPNYIYNSVDACKDAKTMWERIKRLMHRSKITKQVRHSRLMNEFDKFFEVEGESLTSLYERITTLVNVMDQNNIRPLPISVSTKFLNSLQPEWSKYVTMTRQNYNLKELAYDQLFDTLSQFEPHVNASKAKKTARNHAPLALVAQDYQGELQGDVHEDKLTTAMMLLARAITQRYSTPTSNRLCTSSNTRNQVVIKDGRVDIQSKNAGYAGNGNKNAGRQNKIQAANVGNGLENVQCYNCNAKGHYACNYPKPKVCNAKYFKEQMLLDMKDEAGGNLNDKENDFMLDNAYDDDTLEELTAAVIMMAHIQQAYDKGYAEPKYDVEAMSEVNASQINLISGMLSKGAHEHTNHEKLKTVINTCDDDQID
ncbi:hypothetical protein Tco_0854448 [Tanacetum coccineum]